MTELVHVRFRITELVEAVRRAQGMDYPPTVASALTFYWNWARNRGYSLVAVTNQIDPSTAVIYFDRSSKQSELGREESWNVIWSHEGADGFADLVAEVIGPRSLFDNVVQELISRGWFDDGESLNKEGAEISYVAIVAETDIGTSSLAATEIADGLEIEVGMRD